MQEQFGLKVREILKENMVDFGQVSGWFWKPFAMGKNVGIRSDN